MIGAGPAGLSCAYDLIKHGYPVTIFEARKESGDLAPICYDEVEQSRDYW